MPQVRAAVKALITNQNKFLVVEETIDGRKIVDLPGGKVEYTEQPLETLNRELQEELGVSVTNAQPVGVWTFFNCQTKDQIVCSTFSCQLVEDLNQIDLTNNPAPNEEIEAYHLVTKDEFLNNYPDADPGLINFITQLNLEDHIKVGTDCIGVGVGALIFNDQGQFLITKRGPQAKNERGKWEIPGGAVEFGETLEQAIKREVQEELGISIRVKELLTVCDHIIADEGQHWLSPTLICEITAGTAQILEPQKCSELRFVSIKEAQELPLSIATKQDLKELINRGY